MRQHSHSRRPHAAELIVQAIDSVRSETKHVLSALG